MNRNPSEHHGANRQRGQRRDLEFARAAVGEARRRLVRRMGIVSVHWGVQQRRCRTMARPGVVVFVACKRPRDIVPVIRLVPKSLTLTFRGRRRRVRVDVQGLGPTGTWLANEARPGFASRVTLGSDGRTPTGTLGALIEASGSTRGVLSGHVAGQLGVGITAISLFGREVSLSTVEKIVRTATVDIAWTAATDDVAQAELGMRRRAFRDPTELDVGHSATVLVPWDVAGRLVVIRDVGASASFGTGAEAISMRGLCAVHPAVTSPGDSGSPVIDDNGLLIGFVVGASGDRTFLVPARRAIDALRRA